MTTLPLAGYRVLELAHLIAGPACGMYLADMGADVVKIEQPGGGDASRTAYGAHLGAESAVFLTVNRNKRSVVLDLARPDGLAAFDRLVARADGAVLDFTDPAGQPGNRDHDHRTRLSRSRRAVTRAMRGSRSTPTHSRPREAAMRPTVPAPAKGSRTGPRFLLPSSTARTTGSGIASQILSG